MPVETLDIQDPEAVIRAWLAHTDARLEKLPPETAAQNRARSEYMLRLIARGQPVPAAQLALALDRPVEEIEEFYEKYRSVGGEFDAQGNLVGAALTQIPTAHRFRVNGQQLYAWCALDALFMPGLLGKTAEVESICPTTGAAIRLTIAPDRVRAYSPAETVLSITVPGLSCRRDPDDQSTGPSSDACSQMDFFSSRAAAEEWVQNHPGVAILTVEEAFELAQRNWIARRQS